MGSCNRHVGGSTLWGAVRCVCAVSALPLHTLALAWFRRATAASLACETSAYVLPYGVLSLTRRPVAHVRDTAFNPDTDLTEHSHTARMQTSSMRTNAYHLHSKPGSEVRLVSTASSFCYAKGGHGLQPETKTETALVHLTRHSTHIIQTVKATDMHAYARMLRHGSCASLGSILTSPCYLPDYAHALSTPSQSLSLSRPAPHTSSVCAALTAALPACWCVGMMT